MLTSTHTGLVGAAGGSSTSGDESVDTLAATNMIGSFKHERLEINMQTLINRTCVGLRGIHNPVLVLTCLFTCLHDPINLLLQ